MSANARIPIDLNDPKIPLTDALKVLLEFIAEVKQKRFLDSQRQTIYVRDLVWIMLNGHLPREDEWSEDNGVKNLAGWTMVMLYNSSRSLVRDGLPEYPTEMDYCNVQGHDLELSQEAWSATNGFLKTKSIHYPQQAAIISEVINKYFKMGVYPARDKGLLGELVRFVDMNNLFHARIVAGQDAITATMDKVVCIVPGTLDQIRKLEQTVRTAADESIMPVGCQKWQPSQRTERTSCDSLNTRRPH